MPLIKGKSPKAMSQNIKTEMEHGKPQKQAVAIAYAVKRKSQKKARGGMISTHEDEKMRDKMPEKMAGSYYAEGGMAPSAGSGQVDKKEHDGVEPKPKSMRERAIEAWVKAEKAKLSTHSAEEEHDRAEGELHDEIDDEAEKDHYAKGGEVSSGSADMDASAAHDWPNREGHSPDIDAKSEKRPMPEDEHADSGEIARDGMEEDISHDPEHGWLEKRWEEAGRSKSVSPNDSDISAVSEHMTDIDDAEDKEDLHMMREEPTDPEHIDAHHDEDIKRAKFYIGGYAEGGELEDDDKSLAKAVMGRRKSKHATHDMVDARDTEGDQADVKRNAREYPNVEDQLSFDSLDKENYSEEDSLMDQPEDSNEKDIEPHDADEHGSEMIRAIRSRMMKRRG